MGVEQHLSPDEEIKAKYETRKNELYVTDRRLVRYRTSLFNEDMDDMQHEYIASINVRRGGNWKTPGIGIAVLALGVFLFESYFISALGGVLIFFGSLYRSGYYIVKGAGEEKMKICEHSYLLWIWTEQRDKAEEFVRTTRKFIGEA